MKLNVGDVLGPAMPKEGAGDLSRVLAMDEELDSIWLISLGRFDGTNNKKLSYMTAPKPQSLSGLLDSLKAGEWAIRTIATPASWLLRDEDFVALGKTEKEKKRREQRIKDRNERWEIIKPLVEGKTTQQLVPHAASMRGAIKKRAKEADVNITTVYSLIHLFWAFGGILNALMPNTALCGGPGQRRKQTKRIGRKSRVEKSGATTEGLYILQEGDPEKLAMGYALIRPKTNCDKAYVITMGAFWAVTPIDEYTRAGEPILFPIHKRPTKHQFKYWGKQLNTPDDKRRRIGSHRWRNDSPTRRGGSVQDQVTAVGQMGMFDATSTDLYLTSWRSRAIKLPPLTRSTLKDVRSTVVIGFYVGWDAPSPATAMQTILCAAMSKVELCKRFGIEITDLDWPSILCRLMLVDNGEMKAAAITEAERQFGFSVEYAKTYWGPGKGSIESQHHRDHKSLDHQVEGTTSGKQRERGEEHAALNALWNYWEFMREQLLDYIAYNNEEVPDIAPIDMLAAGVKPTRINIFHWLREHGYDAGVVCDIEQLRAFTLPDMPATLNKNGVFLLGHKGTKIVPRIRFYSDELAQDSRFRDAQKSNSSTRLNVKCDPQDLGQVWLPADSGLLKLPNVQSEAAFIRELTLTDWMDKVDSDDVAGDLERGVGEQQRLNTALRRSGLDERAKSQLAEEIKALGTKPSKASVKKDMRKNKEVEKEFVASGSAEPPLASESAPAAPNTSVDEANKKRPLEAVASAMDDFLKESRK